MKAGTYGIQRSRKVEGPLRASLNLSRFAASCRWAGNKTEHKATVHAWSHACCPLLAAMQPHASSSSAAQQVSVYATGNISGCCRSPRRKLSAYTIVQEGRFRTTIDDNLPRGRASAVPESLQQQQPQQQQRGWQWGESPSEAAWPLR